MISFMLAGQALSNASTASAAKVSVDIFEEKRGDMRFLFIFIIIHAVGNLHVFLGIGCRIEGSCVCCAFEGNSQASEHILRALLNQIWGTSWSPQIW